LGHSLAVVAVVFFVIEKNGSQVFLPSLTPLMWHYIVKITWFCPKMPCPQRILFLFGFGGKISHFGRENAVSHKNVIL
jgi:hypothetical protein